MREQPWRFQGGGAESSTRDWTLPSRKRVVMASPARSSLAERTTVPPGFIVML